MDNEHAAYGQHFLFIDLRENFEILSDQGTK